MQPCPVFPNAPQTMCAAASSRSASSATMTPSLPPSSSSIGVAVCAHWAATVLPVATLPVNATLSTPAAISAWPVAPYPMRCCRTAGKSGTARSQARTSHWPTPGVRWLGLRMTALPAARALMTMAPGVISGKFHGPMTPTTPYGWYSVHVCWLGGGLGGRHVAAAQHPLGVVEHELQVCDGAEDLAAGIVDRLAVLRVDERGRLLAGSGDLALPRPQPLRAAVESEVPPGPGDLPGGGDGLGRRLAAVDRIAGQLGAGALIDGDDLTAVEADDAVPRHRWNAVRHDVYLTSADYLTGSARRASSSPPPRYASGWFISSA